MRKILFSSVWEKIEEWIGWVWLCIISYLAITLYLTGQSVPLMALCGVGIVYLLGWGWLSRSQERHILRMFGKYRNQLSSSEEFAKQKQVEIELELENEERRNVALRVAIERKKELLEKVVRLTITTPETHELADILGNDPIIRNLDEGIRTLIFIGLGSMGTWVRFNSRDNS